jgi:hypothetical protein
MLIKKKLGMTKLHGGLLNLCGISWRDENLFELATVLKTNKSTGRLIQKLVINSESWQFKHDVW